MDRDREEELLPQRQPVPGHLRWEYQKGESASVEGGLREGPGVNAPRGELLGQRRGIGFGCTAGKQ